MISASTILRAFGRRLGFSPHSFSELNTRVGRGGGRARTAIVAAWTRAQGQIKASSA